MNRIDKVFSFWEKQQPTLETMMLRLDAQKIESQERMEILSYLPPLQGKKILELGAGIGRFTTHFGRLGSVVAVDFIPSFIEKNKIANKHLKPIEYICQDVMQVQFAPGQFDFIFMNHLLMYLEDEEVETLSERCYKWLAEDGHLFFRESCSAAGRRLDDDYYVTYRTIFSYTQLFSHKFTLLKQESLKLFELHFANPFQCYWLYQKRSRNKKENCE
jgi:phosphoethanolamine N-methyltransferase